MLGALSEDPALMTVAAPGDGPLALARAAGGLGGNQAQIGHELTGGLEAMDVPQFTDGDHGRDHLKAAAGLRRQVSRRLSMEASMRSTRA